MFRKDKIHPYPLTLLSFQANKQPISQGLPSSGYFVIGFIAEAMVVLVVVVVVLVLVLVFPPA